jgi:flagellar assembly factor FliW
MNTTPQSFPPGVEAITFADGLPGFEACRHFVVMSSAELAPFMCIQGLGEQAPSFLAIDPRLVVDGYPCELGELDRTRLDTTQGRPLLWLAIVSPDAAGAKVNLRAPIVISPETMRGVQVLDGDPAYALDYRLTSG